MEKKFRCTKCKTEQEELWEFGPLELFKKYWNKAYCESCFVKLFNKLWKREE